MAPPKRVVSPSSPSGSSAKKVRAPSHGGAEFETQPPDDQGLSSVDGEAVGEPVAVEDIAVGRSTHLAAPLAGGRALEDAPQAGLAEVEYVDDPFSDEQHATWDARVMVVVRKEGISPQVFPLTVAATLLQIILRDIKTSVKPALLDRDEIKLIELLLQHRDTLLPALEQALRTGRFAAVRCMALLREDATSSSSEGTNADFIHTPSSGPIMPPRLRAQAPTSFVDIERAILDFEKKIRPELQRYVMGNHPTFNPPSSAAKDSTLFIDGIGGMSEKDPAVRGRVEKLFSGETDTDQSLRLLFNTSGTGKTTLLVEGLCRNWGLYVVSCYDENHPMGSKDVDTAWKFLQIDPGFTPKVPLTPTKNDALANNVKIAARTFRSVLLARLSILDFFLRCAPAHVNEADLRRRWVYLQLRPSRLFQKMDIFNELFRTIYTVQDDSAVRNRIFALQKAICEDVHVNVGSLFFALDEAQVASQRGTDAFYSATSGGGQRSVLCEMYNAWSEFSMPMIISGTGLPLELVMNSTTSAMGKEVLWPKLFSDTGFFDDEDRMRSYIIDRVWPNRELTDTEDQILKRAWRWLRGRHRLTAGYTLLLQRMGVASANKILDAYIKVLADGFEATDGKAFARKEPDIDITKVAIFSRIDFSSLRDPRNARLEGLIFRAVMNVVVRNRSHMFFAEFVDAVSLGFARVTPEKGLVDFSGQTQSVKQLPQRIDEPLVVAAALHYFLSRPSRSMRDFVARPIQGVEEASTLGFAVENIVTITLARVFKDGATSLCDAFTLRKTDGQAWLSEPVHLVSITGRTTDGTFLFEDSGLGQRAVLLLGYEASSPEEVEDWLRCAKSIFCYPDATMGPDIIFLVRCGVQLVWVLVQVKRLAVEALTTAETNLRNVDPGRFYRARDGQPHCPKSRQGLTEKTRKLMNIPGTPVVRLAVSFPAEPHADILEEAGSAGEIVATFDRLAEGVELSEALAILSAYMPK